MTKQQAREQRRKAKKLARLLGHRDFKFEDSFSCPGDGVLGVAVSLKWNGQEYQATGASKCNRIDTWNENIGVEIATGRALLRIAYQILKDQELQRLQDTMTLKDEVMKAFEDFQTMLGVKIYVDKSPELDIPLKTQVPGSAAYRGEEQHGWGIKPEYVPSGLEVIKKMEEEDRDE
jgi:hypothetical protein